MATQIPARLGDILIRSHYLRPHQLGVALEVQQKTRLPLGQVLVGTNLITPLQLCLALLRQKLMRFTGTLPKNMAHYGRDLAVRGRELLEKHFAAMPAVQAEQSAEEKLRAELARLPHGRIARIIEADDKLKQRIISGNF